ncbi:MAG: zf-HC2 domain-containing protein [Phycisphaerales bacterium]
MNRSCPQMQDQIVDYVLGALDEPQAQVVKEHVDRCDGCRRYLAEVKRECDALAELGGQVAAGMNARRDRVIEALEGVGPTEATPSGIIRLIGRFVRVAVAAVLILGAGIVIGRMTAPRPVDAERLRADLEASIVASLKPAIQESVLAGLQERLEAALASNDTKLRVEVAEQISRDLRMFASQFTASSEKLLDRRFTELVEVIEAARLTDRRQVARALERITTQTGTGLRTVAALAEEPRATLEN